MKTQTDESSKTRLVSFIALAIAPSIAAAAVSVCLVLFAWLFILPYYHHIQGAEPLVKMFLSWWTSLSQIASLIAWTFGFSWHVVAIRRNWRRAIDYVLAGVALGAVAGVAGACNILAGVFPLVGLLLVGAALMSGSMWLFWLIRRPDRDIAVEAPGVVD